MNKFFLVDPETIGIKHKLYGEYVTCLFDLSDYELIKQYTFRICSHGYVQCRKKRTKDKFLMVHNVLMNPPEGKEVDHIKGNRQDNRRSQMRNCTHQQNTQNRHGINKCPGIYLDKRLQRYYAQVKINGKNKQIGMFKEYSEAVNARNQAVKQHYGEYACIY
jgi:hypothetical protein